MKFLYKIWSGYDGFTPRQIVKRLRGGKSLSLGWAQYVDSVEEGHEVWIYFHGPRVQPPGVYAKGFVRSIDAHGNKVEVRLRDYSENLPLTDATKSAEIAQVIRARGLQVFVYPEAWDTPPSCNLDLGADSCRARGCESCSAWKRLPLIEPRACLPPRRFPSGGKALAPGYWVIPSRCYLRQEGTPINRGVEHTSELFYRFKSGEGNLAYPLALGIYHALRKRRLLDFDCIVPIPLSPDKAAAGEIHRTRLLAQELESLLDTRVDELLSLTEPISKHRLPELGGLTAIQFESKYSDTLAVDARVSSYALVTDRRCVDRRKHCALRHPRNSGAELESAVIVAASAGQMIVKHVVADGSGLVR